MTADRHSPATVRRLFEGVEPARGQDDAPQPAAPRLGRGVRWSDVVAEIERDRQRSAPDEKGRAA